MTSLLTVQGVTKRFSGLIAVQDVNFTIENPAVVGIIGPNGAGKTTLFNLLSGNDRPDAGRIVFQGREIGGAKSHQICRLGVGRTFQIAKPFADLTVFQGVTIGALNRESSLEHARKRAEAVLEQVGLAHVRAELGRNLTVLQRKRFEVARALATGPKLLLLDEVAAGLRPTEADELVVLLRTLREQGISILMVEHVLRVVMTLCERVLVLNHGQLLADGTPAEVTRDPRVITAYLGEGDDSAHH